MPRLPLRWKVVHKIRAADPIIKGLCSNERPALRLSFLVFDGLRKIVVLEQVKL
ncbi:MAG: hypothetical protein ACYTDT_06850 [Planctomycetota bacterium]